MKKYNLIIGGLLLSLFGCTSVDEPVQVPETSEETAGTTEPIYFMVPDKSRTVSDGNKAVEIADRFLKGHGVRSRDAVAANANRIDLDNGEAAMYVVNYGDEGGFVIVSATKDTEPILAYSETGSFDMEKLEGSPVEMWISETKEYVEYSHLLPDSVKVQYAAQWNELTYGKNYLSNLMSRSWGDAEEMARVQEALGLYRNRGYEIIEKPSSNVNLYTYTLNQALDALSDSKEWDGYTQRDKSYLLIKTEYSNRNKPSMVTTEWDQWGPYNAKLVAYSGDDQDRLGCVTVAVGQLLKYYNKPGSEYNYDMMPDILSPYEKGEKYEILTDFLFYLGKEKLEIDYDHKKYNANIKKAKEVLIDYGFKNAEQINYDFFAVLSHIDRGPIFLEAYVPSEGSGHAWVCDGYNFSSVESEYIIITYTGNYMDADPSACFQNLYQETLGSGQQSLHMNWGWGGHGNGFYYYDNWQVRMSDGKINDMSTDRHAIVNLN